MFTAVTLVNIILAVAGTVSFVLGTKHFLFRGEWASAGFCSVIAVAFAFIAVYAAMLLTPEPLSPLYARIAVWPIYAGLTVAVLQAIVSDSQVEHKIREYDDGDN